MGKKKNENSKLSKFCFCSFIVCVALLITVFSGLLINYYGSEACSTGEWVCDTYETVEKYELVDSTLKKDCYGLCIHRLIFREPDLNKDYKQLCKERCTKITKPYIRYWNESVCVRETLVRYPGDKQ